MATSTSPAISFRPPVGWPRRTQRVSVGGGSRAPELVRAWLGGATRGLPEELERNLMLLTCELVNNSVLHGQAGEHDQIEIELRTTATGVWAEVSDAGPGFSPPQRERAIDEPGGWGLVLVDRLAERWGVEGDDGTRVWFELAR